MRKNTRRVFDAWLNGNADAKSESVWTDGTRIFSYQTVLVERNAGKILVNVTKYSPTTSTHQNGIRSEFNRVNMIPNDFLDDVAKGRKVLA